MAKMKGHKGIQKRMRRTRRGKVMRRRANRGHLMSGKRSKRRRRLRGKSQVMTGQARQYARLLKA
jgi:large subunit ribosomal protein L35